MARVSRSSRTQLVGISLPDQVYNYTNGIITDSLAIYQGSTTDAKYTAIFDAEIYETIPVTNARVQSTIYSHELQAWGFCVHVKEGVNQ